MQVALRPAMQVALWTKISHRNGGAERAICGILICRVSALSNGERNADDGLRVGVGIILHTRKCATGRIYLY